MGFEVRWTQRAILTFGHRIDYLQHHWTEREILNFTTRVSEYLKSLESEPLMFRKSTKLKNTHIGVIIRQVSVVYRVKPKSKVIELVAFLDNRQGPKKNRY